METLERNTSPFDPTASPVLTVQIKKLTPSAIAPQRANPLDSGMDLFSDDWLTLAPYGRALVPTGLAMKLPRPLTSRLYDSQSRPILVDMVWELQIRSKSGRAIKEGLVVLNSPGTVDSNYTGEIKVILYNASKEVITIAKGEKIAQAVLCPVTIPTFEFVDSFDADSEGARGEKGFGSSGLCSLDVNLG